MLVAHLDYTFSDNALDFFQKGNTIDQVGEEKPSFQEAREAAFRQQFLDTYKVDFPQAKADESYEIFIGLNGVYTNFEGRGTLHGPVQANGEREFRELQKKHHSRNIVYADCIEISSGLVVGQVALVVN